MPECPKCQNIEMELGTMLHGTGPFGMSTSVLRIQIKRPAQDDPYHYIAYHIDGYRCPQCGYVEMVANRRT
ncbi:MAG: hypothetical protein ACFFBL_00510 [Promethearchaeota archaeon]